jgi:hypothetical protein
MAPSMTSSCNAVVCVVLAFYDSGLGYVAHLHPTNAGHYAECKHLKYLFTTVLLGLALCRPLQKQMTGLDCLSLEKANKHFEQI